VYANDVFPLGATELPILRPTAHSSRCCTLFISVVLIYVSTNQQHPLKKLVGKLISYEHKYKYNMDVVGWGNAVEK